MSDQVVRKLLEQRVNSVSGALASATAFENVAFTPSEGTPWQRVNLLPAQPENPTMGDDFYRAVGVLQVSLFYPRNAGSAQAYAQGEVLRTAFKRGTMLSEGTLRVRVIGTPSLGPGIPAGGWYMLPVSVNYQADVHP